MGFSPPFDDARSLLVAVGYATTIAGITSALRRPGEAWRLSLLVALTGCGALLVAFTEILGATRALGTRGVALLWTVTLALSLAAVARRRAWPTTPRTARLGHGVRLLLGLQAVLAATVLVIAVASAPNNGDSHVYHLARVQHWLQHASVAHYPTGIERQIDAPPWSSYALAHLQLLALSDRLANLVQWSAWIGCALASSLVAMRLGANAAGQVAASGLVLSVPMGILQASSTQNDLVMSFWLVTFVALGLESVHGHRVSPRLTAACGAALGLALLTKGVAWVYAPPFVLWLAVAHARRNALGRTLAAIGAAGTIALLLCAPYWARNVAASGSPLGPGYVIWSGREVAYGNASFGPGATVNNVARSIALQLGAPDLDRLLGAPVADRLVRRVGDALALPSGQSWNARLVTATSHLLRALRLDPDDPANTWDGRRFRIPASGWNFEDTAGNPLHLVLYTIVLGVGLIVPATRDRTTLTFAGCCVAGFVAFNAVFAWQTYHSRLNLPLFVLLAAPVAATLTRIGRDRLTVGIVALLLVLATPWVVNNLTRPMLGPASVFRVPRFDQYFAQHPALKSDFLAVAERIRDLRCRDVAVIVHNDAWEYPLWRALREVGFDARIRHTAIANYTRSLPAPMNEDTPCIEVEITSTFVRLRAPDAGDTGS